MLTLDRLKGDCPVCMRPYANPYVRGLYRWRSSLCWLDKVDCQKAIESAAVVEERNKTMSALGALKGDCPACKKPYPTPEQVRTLHWSGGEELCWLREVACRKAIGLPGAHQKTLKLLLPEDVPANLKEECDTESDAFIAAYQAECSKKLDALSEGGLRRGFAAGFLAARGMFVGYEGAKKR